MQIEKLEFETIETEIWKVRVTILGEGFVQRAIPIVATIGEQSVEGIVPLFDPVGIMGFLSEIPSDGDLLSVGYMDESMIETDFRYNGDLVG